jgi:exopolysaccharide biosynthesis protein
MLMDGGIDMLNKNTKIKKPLRKKILIITITTIMVISTILYNLAYRYLIERAEDPVKSSINNTSISTSKVSTEVNSDDWNYKSDNLEIKIEEVTEGTVTNKVTYFVADVKVKDSSLINSAFAKDTFGRNIIDTPSNIAKENNAIFAINGDSYGFRGDGVLIRNGTLYRDTATRISAALYNDGTMKSFDETKISSEDLIASGVIDTFSFGPVLVKDGTVEDNFDNVAIDTNFGNRSIQASNPRTAMGIIEPNHFVFVVVDGRKENYSKGMTLSELAKTMGNLGCVEAYNLDGGANSRL